MRVSLKPACPDCGKPNLWINYIFRRPCPNCKAEFVITKYSILSSILIFLMITGVPFFGIDKDDLYSTEGLVIIFLAIIIALMIAPLAFRFKSKKTGKELYPPKNSSLKEQYIFQVFLLSFFMFWIMFCLFSSSSFLKRSLPDYLLDLYPSFTKITMWLIPATEQLFFASVVIIIGGYLFFASAMILNCPRKKLFSYGLKFIENSYKIIVFTTVFLLAGLFVSFVPYFLNLLGKSGENAINICNYILWILFILTPALIWFINKKAKHTISSLNKKIMILPLINPIIISVCIALLVLLTNNLTRWWFEGEPMPLLMQLIVPENYTHRILAILVIICLYFIVFTKSSRSVKKLRCKLNFCLSMNRFPLLILLAYICSLAFFISHTAMGYTQCMCGGHEPWNKMIYPALNWLALGIAAIITILIFPLSRKIKNRKKCKWIYLTGLFIFFVFYLPVNKKIHPTVTQTGFINKKGEIVIMPQFAHVGIFKSGLCNASFTKFSFLNRTGFINKKGEWVITPKFISAYPFSNDFASVTPSLTFMSRFINKKGEFLNSNEYKRTFPFYDGLARVEIGKFGNWRDKSKNGYINTKGKLVILKPNDSESGNFSEGLAWIQVKANLKGKVKEITDSAKPVINNKCMFPTEEERKNSFTIDMLTFIDKGGNFAIKHKNKNPMLFLEAGNFSEGLAWVRVKIDSKGKVNYSLEDEESGMLCNNNTSSSLDKVGFINRSGNFVIKPQFSDAQDFKEGMAPVRFNVKWGYINKKGQLVVKPKYIDVDAFSGGLARIKSQGKYGFIDKTGKEVIPVIYEDAERFSEGLAAVEKNGLWGYIDKTGKFIIKPQFHYARRFSEGLAAVYVKMEY